MTRFWNEFKRSRDSEVGGSSSKYFYYYLVGWCAVSMVIAFFLLPPLSLSSKNRDSSNSISNHNSSPQSQLASWFSILFKPNSNLSNSTHFLPNSKLFVAIPISKSILETENSQENQIPDSLDQPNLSPPTAQEILGPIRYPYPSSLPKTSSDGLTFHPNGHLLLHLSSNFSSLQTHPFKSLIERAKLEWETKLKRQSKTLKECVEEYKRRYARKPPAGFERWYDYATRNNVILIDEYDQISRDLFPFWALSPNELRARGEILRSKQNTRRFEISFINGTWIRTGPFKDLTRVIKLVELFQLFTKDLIDSNLKSFPLFMEDEDRGQILLGWDQYKRLFELARLGQYLPTEYKVEPERDIKGWAASCPPNSALRRTRLNEFDQLMKTSNHSWIVNHIKSMDVCTDPERIDLHGATASGVSPPQPLVPLFAFSKTSLHADILITPLEQYSNDYPGKETPWEQRPYQKVYWRGSTTGSDFSDNNPQWVTSHRMRLYRFTHERNSTANVLIGGEGLKTEGEDSVRDVKVSRAELNDQFMNITFVGQPIQCEPNVCELLAKTIDFVPPVNTEEVGLYKYAFDVDGNGWSGRFHRLLFTKHLVIKSTVLPEWYAERIQPWYHYVPSKVDYTDLYDIMTFFSGGINGTNGHDQLAEKIANQGQDWAKKHWRMEDMAAYMFRLMLEWNRLYNRSDDGSSSDFDESILH
ncbi:hypothetical protein CROQUDRAFT_722443 [Cronartium quercuum f. sp. fusiforme G11]|uniref:Glycosyl transferase CAP10 domain-containing protein n=1 Tax=Cronartium quercuum f. sp. fusiforme G11 TaxID=708437 RepID=A0A9P6TCZ3_9BASI|nr:hypothetical protein CROQUDRAFT_722443 [Cronartium quercuum f. sp. fusiforme G11]